MMVSLPVRFSTSSALLGEERQAVHDLMVLCRESDGFDPYLHFDCHLSAAPGLASWRLAWVIPARPDNTPEPDGDCSPRGSCALLAGVACAFSPLCTEVEISACVAPVFRRQGVYSALYDSLRDETLAPGSRPVLLVCSGNSAEGARIAGSSGASVTRSRYRMILTSSCLEKIAAPDCVRLVPVTDENAEEASRVSAAIFNRAPVDACCFMKALLADPVREQFLVVASRGTVGLVGVASAGTDYCVHGLGVLPQFRTGGYGAGALDAVLSVLKERRVGLVALDVDTNNAAALSLLRSRGFAVASRADYWLLPGARKDSQ